MSVSNISPTSTFKNALNGIPKKEKNWKRNPSWITVTPPTTGEQKIVALLAIFDNNTPVCFGDHTGATTVNWGDGTSNNYASSVASYHEYDYNNPLFDGTNAPVTITDSGDLITRNSHGYVDGNKVSFYDIVSTTGIDSGSEYFVVNATTNTFQISTEKNGTPVVLSNNGSAALLPYKQAIVTITPQAGQNLLNVAFNNAFILSEVPAAQRNGTSVNHMLEIFFSLPNITNFIFGTAANGIAITFPLLESVTFITLPASGSISGNGSSFISMPNLRYIKTFMPLRFLSGVTAGTTFRNCFNLVEVDLDFTGCNTTEVPNMFNNCYNLQTVRIKGLSTVTNALAMFQGCTSLETVPLLDFSSALTNVGLMFNTCYSLKDVAVFDTSGVTNFSSMFSQCYALRSVPKFNMSAGTDLTSMFFECTSLENIPALTLKSTGTITAASMFNTCRSLKQAPNMNTSRITSFNQTFSSCFSLTDVPEYDLTSATTCASMFFNCFNLKNVKFVNGSSALSTVTQMFNGCTSLETAPALNLSGCTIMGTMFNNCAVLTQVPTYTTNTVTDFNSMFISCKALQTIPAFNMTSASSVGGMFQSTGSIVRVKVTNCAVSLSLTSQKLSKTEIENIMNNSLVRSITSPTFNIDANPGSFLYSLTGTTTSGSTTVTMASTTGLTTGMEISATNISSAVAVTMQDAGDTVTRVTHGIPNDTPISFTTITSTTGIATYTTYYVINAATNTFQLSTSVGGSAIALTTDGSGNIIYGTTITAITPNTNITLSIPASGSGLVTTNSGLLKRSIGRLKGFTVLG